MMAKFYKFNIEFTACYTVEARDSDEAEDKAYKLLQAEIADGSFTPYSHLAKPIEIYRGGMNGDR